MIFKLQVNDLRYRHHSSIKQVRSYKTKRRKRETKYITKMILRKLEKQANLEQEQMVKNVISKTMSYTEEI